jgi:DNA-binding MarR family transcriptional regulator
LVKAVKRRSVAVSSLEDHLGYWLRFVSNQVSQAFAAKLTAHDVSVAEWVTLRELFDVEALAPSELAEKLGMTRGAITKLADRLIGKRLIARRAGEEDRRYQTLALTQAGRELVPQLAAVADRNDAEFFGRLTKEDRAHIEKIMRGIVQRRGLTSVPVD